MTSFPITKLLPCPFCGNTDLQVRAHYHGGHTFVAEIYCEYCHLRMQQFKRDDKGPWSEDDILRNNQEAAEKVIAAWNNRFHDNERG